MDSWITNVLQSMGPAGVALLMALENVFPPIPSEVIMPLAGYMSAQGKMSIWLAMLAGSVGTVIGTLPWYGAARWLRNDSVRKWIERHGHWLAMDRDDLERAERWFAMHGRWMVAIGRLVPGVRTLISVPAGFCGMPLWQYVGYSAIGTLIWSGALIWLGRLLGENYAQISVYLEPVTWVILTILVMVYLVRLVRLRKQNHERRRGHRQLSRG